MRKFTLMVVLMIVPLLASLAWGVDLEDHLEQLREELNPQEQRWLGWALLLEQVDAAAVDSHLDRWVEVSGEVAEVLAYRDGRRDPEPEIHLKSRARVVCWPAQGNWWRALQVGDQIVVRAWAQGTFFGTDLVDCTLARPAVALLQFDDNRNGQITCAEAREHGIAPVTSTHPAYRYMHDGDSDGVVCE